MVPESSSSAAPAVRSARALMLGVSGGLHRGVTPGGRDRFSDRAEAGTELAKHLTHLKGDPAVVVLGLPRGGVPVARKVADELGAPLDVFVVRKLGVPGHEELAMGAVSSGGARYLNDEVISQLGIPPDVIDLVTERESAELDRQQRNYRGDRSPLDLAGKTPVLVDDGLATGSTMIAGVQAARRQNPKRVVVAVPVAAAQVAEKMKEIADEVVVAMIPPTFWAVGTWYDDFSQVSDEEVRALLSL